jgi:hypothetical protein
MRAWVVALACVVTAVTELTSQQTSQTTAAPTRAAFAAADRTARLEMLKAISRPAIDRGEPNVAPEELAGIVSLALRDSDVTIREAACYLVMVTAARSRGQYGTAATPRWQAAATALLSLHDQLARVMAADVDPRIRHSAVLALGNLRMTVSPSGVIRIPADLAEVLAASYGKETADRVRVEIVKSFALSETDSPRRQEILAQALMDSSPSVIQFAVMGAGSMKLSPALPRLVELATHPDRGIRAAVPQALAAYGAEAVPYLPQLQKALASEQDDVVRKTLEGAIRVIQKAKDPGPGDPIQTLRARVDLVEVDVVVTGGKGQVVRGLRASDFQVFEDKRPVKIDTFREVVVPDTPIRAGESGQGIPVDDGRPLVLVFDDWHVPYLPRVFNRTKEIARLRLRSERHG